MIDFIYVKVLTSAPKFIKKKIKNLRMTTKGNNKENLTGDKPDFMLVEYYDFFVTQKNKKVAAKNLGEKTALLNSYFFEYLKGYNIPCAFVKKDDKKKIQVINVVDFRFRVKILNAADGRTAKIFSIKPGSSLELPILEYHFGDAKESVITESHIISFNLCSYEDLKMINRLCSKINAIVKSFFERRNVSLLELTCRFGKFDGKIYLIGDFSPVSIKVLDSKKEESLPDPYKIETTAQMNKYSD
jgi:phosphoribosylaminoimidazole-succinocarboxamide synthase